MKNRFAKIFTAAILGVTMIASMVACGKKEPVEINAVSDLKFEKYMEIADYSEIEVELQGDYTVDEALVTDYVNYYYSQAESYASRIGLITDRAAEDGDLVNIDYAGYKDGEAFEGGTAEDQTLRLGSHSFIDGFEDGLIGVMPGETVDLNLTFPENYGNQELAGAEVVFTVTVHGIIPEENVIIAWNTSVVMGGLAITKDDIADYYREALAEQNEENRKNDIDNAIIDAVLGLVTYKEEFPETLIKAYQDNAQQILANYANSYGADEETIAQYMFGMSAEDYITNSSYQQLQIDASLQFIASKEGLIIPEDQVFDKIVDYYSESGVEVKQEDLDEDAMKDFRLFFTELAVLDFLEEKAIVK